MCASGAALDGQVMCVEKGCRLKGKKFGVSTQEILATNKPFGKWPNCRACGWTMAYTSDAPERKTPPPIIGDEEHGLEVLAAIAESDEEGVREVA